MAGEFHGPGIRLLHSLTAASKQPAGLIANLKNQSMAVTGVRSAAAHDVPTCHRSRTAEGILYRGIRGEISIDLFIGSTHTCETSSPGCISGAFAADDDEASPEDLRH